MVKPTSMLGALVAQDSSLQVGLATVAVMPPRPRDALCGQVRQRSGGHAGLGRQQSEVHPRVAGVGLCHPQGRSQVGADPRVAKRVDREGVDRSLEGGGGAGENAHRRRHHPAGAERYDLGVTAEAHHRDPEREAHGRVGESAADGGRLDQAGQPLGPEAQLVEQPRGPRPPAHVGHLAGAGDLGDGLS